MTSNLYKGDCMEVLPSIATGSIDMVLADLPYGTTANKWDSVLPLDALWEEYKRVVKPNGAIVLFAQVPFSASLGASNLEMLRYEWIWRKSVATGHLNANRHPMKEHENILVFYKYYPTYNPQYEVGKPYIQRRQPKDDRGDNYQSPCIRTDTINDGRRYPRSVLDFPVERGLHPTQKPVPLCEYLIRTYTSEGDTILDNTMGSGTTCVAAVNTRRGYIGIEKDEAYFEVARKRVQDATIKVVQDMLFDIPL